MNVKFLKVCVLFIVNFSVLFAGGYKIPANSIESIATAGASVASANGANSSYYNPANMIFDNSSDQEIEFGLSGIYLSSVEFESSASPVLSDKAHDEFAVFPNFYYISKPYGDLRYGLSIVSPVGISKRWDGALSKLTANDSQLRTLEANPSVSYKINDNFAIGGGVSVIAGKIYMKNDSGDLYNIHLAPAYIFQEYKGNATDFGYNLALTYKNVDYKLSATYRSKVNLHFDGDSTIAIQNRNMGVL